MTENTEFADERSRGRGPYQVLSERTGPGHCRDRRPGRRKPTGAAGTIRRPC
jgi:hypothetical protein